MTRLALKDDHTSTGGRILGGSSDFYAEDGRSFALDGDKATCGNCKGLWPILGSARNWMDNGRSMVKDLDPVHCPCGKNLVFASGSSPFDYETGGSSEMAAASASPLRVAATPHDQHFEILNSDGFPVQGLRYRLNVEGKDVIDGVTDAHGKTARVDAQSAQKVKLSIIVEGE